MSHAAEINSSGERPYWQERCQLAGAFRWATLQWAEYSDFAEKHFRQLIAILDEEVPGYQS